MMKVLNTAAWFAEFQKDLEDFEQKECIPIMREAALFAIESFQRVTPVWKGNTVRNYRVGIGGSPVGPMRQATYTEPENTRKMPMGPEKNRPANEKMAIRDAIAVLNSYKDLSIPLFVGNTVAGGGTKELGETKRPWDSDGADKFTLIDAGLAPDPPGRNRNVGGVIKYGTQSVKGKFRGTL